MVPPVNCKHSCVFLMTLFDAFAYCIRRVFLSQHNSIVNKRALWWKEGCDKATNGATRTLGRSAASLAVHEEMAVKSHKSKVSIPRTWSGHVLRTRMYRIPVDVLKNTAPIVVSPIGGRYCSQKHANSGTTTVRIAEVKFSFPTTTKEMESPIYSLAQESIDDIIEELHNDRPSRVG
ncbi:hypothetical protein DFS33DRAFT_1397864 [Desarmillaria ectypa]|nr:hypothetical protein DFS33DRAFT_1397864 [Desarmillaria ectypa]